MSNDPTNSNATPTPDPHGGPTPDPTAAPASAPDSPPPSPPAPTSDIPHPTSTPTPNPAPSPPAPTSDIPHPTSPLPSSPLPLLSSSESLPDFEETPTPDLPSPADFVAALIAADYEVSRITLPLTPAQRMALINDPLVHALMDQNLAFEIACLSILQVKARRLILTSLQSLLADTTNPVEKRRILATLNSASAPMRVPPPRKRLIDPPAKVPTLSLPRADLTPDQVLHNLSCALYQRNNDINGINQGLATFVAHCEYRATIDHAPLNPDDQHASIDTLARSGLMKLRGWTDARQVPPPPPDRLAIEEKPPEPGTRTTLSCVYDIPDRPQLRVTYHLSKAKVNTRHPDCWLIRAITTARPKPTKTKTPKPLSESDPNHPKNYYRTSSSDKANGANTASSSSTNSS